MYDLSGELASGGKQAAAEVPTSVGIEPEVCRIGKGYSSLRHAVDKQSPRRRCGEKRAVGGRALRWMLSEQTSLGCPNWKVREEKWTACERQSPV